MNLLETVHAAWGFTGLVPRSIIDTNSFGNLLVEDNNGVIWRVCPEELSCEKVASSAHAVQELQRSAEFKRDWEMQPLVDEATAALGAPSSGQCFCLKTPAILGGKYECENVGTISLLELISFAGDLAVQIKDMPTGSKVHLTIN
ncbi:MAG TPA: T6SS immunity protein Tdi1 domain-containing protein [Pyrinomonadaceae bacterium]